MRRFYSDTLARGIELLYFQNDTSKYPEGVRLVEEACANNEPDAYYIMARCYAWGDATTIQSGEDIAELEAQNGRESIKWYTMAAKQGHIPSFKNLYISTYKGQNGVPKDINRAFMYAENLKDKVQIPPYLCDTIGGDYESVKNYTKMVEWYERGVAAGGKTSINNLGFAYLNGTGVAKNYDKAFELFTMGKDKGEPYSAYNLGRCYFFGWGCKEDKSQAFKLFKIAANANHKAAQAYLAQYYYEGLAGVPADYTECRRWAQRSAGNGYYMGKYYLGKCYLYGNGVLANYEIALRMFKECVSKADYAEAYLCMGEMYEKGLGVSVDYNQAVAYYQKAAGLGCADANAELARFKKSFLGNNWKLRKS